MPPTVFGVDAAIADVFVLAMLYSATAGVFFAQSHGIALGSAPD